MYFTSKAPGQHTRRSFATRVYTHILRGVLIISLGLLITGCGSGAAVESNTGSPPPPPPPPPEPDAAVLSWSANTEGDLAGYRVYYGIVSGSYLQSFGQGIDVGNSTTYTVTGLYPGMRNYFAVTAYDFAGNESGYSVEVFKDVPP